MKLLTCFTESHKVFLNQFLQSLDCNGLDIILREHSQECRTGEFASEGWNITTRRKFEFILDCLEMTVADEAFIFSDIDIQYYKSPKLFCDQVLSECDIAFQNDYYGHACTGFFYAKNNNKVKNLLNISIENIDKFRDDQEVVNHLLQNQKIDINYKLLPKEFFTYGMYYSHWDPSKKEFKVPQNMVMHHANWVIGIDNKLDLLNAAKENYNNKNFIL